MWHLPQGAEYVGTETWAHPRDGVGSYYYRLIRWLAPERYALLGMCGEIRTCPQAWARERSAEKEGG